MRAEAERVGGVKLKGYVASLRAVNQHPNQLENLPQKLDIFIDEFARQRLSQIRHSRPWKRILTAQRQPVFPSLDWRDRRLQRASTFSPSRENSSRFSPSPVSEKSTLNAGECGSPSANSNVSRFVMPALLPASVPARNSPTPQPTQSNTNDNKITCFMFPISSQNSQFSLLKF